MSLLGLALRNLRRNRLRVTLTVFGIMIAVLAFVVFRTVITAWEGAADYMAKDRIVSRHKVTFVMTLPKRYIEQVRAIKGVQRATYANWFGGRHPKRDREFFPTLAVESKTWFDVYDDMAVANDQLAAWQQDRRGAIVGDVLAKKFGWKVGDRINLKGSIFPGTWSFNLRGIYHATRRSIDRSEFIFHWDYLNQSLPEAQRDQIGWIVSRIADSSQGAAIGAAIDKHFDPADTQTQSSSERDLNNSFLGMFSAVLKAVDIVSVVIVVIMLLILGNTIAMGVRERTAEYGMMRAVGFSGKHILALVVAEATWVGAIGTGLGLLAAYPLVERGLGRFIEENLGAMFPYFRVATSTVLTGVCIGLSLGAVAAVLPAYRASKLRVVDALRRVG